MSAAGGGASAAAAPGGGGAVVYPMGDRMFLTLDNSGERIDFRDFVSLIKTVDEVPWVIVWMEDLLVEYLMRSSDGGVEPILDTMNKKISEVATKAVRAASTLDCVARDLVGGDFQVDDFHKRCAQILEYCDSIPEASVKERKNVPIDEPRAMYNIAWTYGFMRMILDRRDVINMVVDSQEAPVGEYEVIQLRLVSDTYWPSACHVNGP
jgi:hypothetical protein